MSRLLRSPPLDPDAAWATIRAALDLVFTFPDDAGPAPALDAAHWAAAYAAVWAWSTTSRVRVSKSDHMAVLYQHLESYVAEVCARLRPHLAEAPRALLDTYLALYGAFRAHAAVAARIMAYLDRHHTARVRDEGKGWLRHVKKGAMPPHSREKYQNAAQPALTRRGVGRELPRVLKHWLRRVEGGGGPRGGGLGAGARAVRRRAGAVPPAVAARCPGAAFARAPGLDPGERACGGRGTSGASAIRDVLEGDRTAGEGRAAAGSGSAASGRVARATWQCTSQTLAADCGLLAVEPESLSPILR
jgi:hypothetical protein